MIADADGLEALTMQRVAAHLGFTKMSLYRHVTGKPDLLALMIDAAIGPPPAAMAGSAGWRDKLTAWAVEMADMLERHPWLVPATGGARVLGPNELAWMNAAPDTLRDTGLDGRERMDALLVINSHLRSAVQQAASMDVTASGTHQLLSAALEELLDGRREDYPALTATLADLRASTESGYAFGLGRILDGIELLTSARSAAG